MRPSPSRLATALGSAPKHMRDASAGLLPPIPLYRALLRQHRSLEIDMRSIGDAYVKDEFRRHKKADNPIHIMGFLIEWKKYLDGLRAGDLTKGKPLEMEKLEKMSNEQVAQLYELMHATKEIWKSPEEVAAESADGSESDPIVEGGSKSS